MPHSSLSACLRTSVLPHDFPVMLHNDVITACSVTIKTEDFKEMIKPERICVADCWGLCCDTLQTRMLRPKFWDRLLPPSYPKAEPNRYFQSIGNRQRPNLNNYLCGNPKFWNHWSIFLIMILIYMLTAIVLTPGGSSTVHIYTQTVHRTTQLTTLVWKYLHHCTEHFVESFNQHTN